MQAARHLCEAGCLLTANCALAAFESLSLRTLTSESLQVRRLEADNLIIILSLECVMYRASRKKSKLSSLRRALSWWCLSLREWRGAESARWKIHSLFLEWLIIFIIQNRKITGLACARINQRREIALTTLLSFCLEFWEGSSASWQ